MSRAGAVLGKRVVAIAGVACVLAAGAAVVAQLLTRAIGLVTNLAYYGRLSTSFVAPGDHHLGVFAVLVPVAGALVIGVMARYGSKAIRGHGIPEAMEQVLTNQSKIPPRITILKPLSAVISIGTGGPFGAEGPIIATGGALGSLIGQHLHITTEERKTLLAAGAAAGMAATFGSPVAAVLLAIELLLFEYRARSVIPVALAAVTATAIRIAFQGSSAPAFAVTDLVQPPGAALAIYVLVGAVVGLAAVGVTRLVYWIEDTFERLPIHWMWWPALGAIPVGVIGLIAPRTLGVGYDNIEQMVSGTLGGTALAAMCAWKLASWSIALGSGTSGGTLAPLFTIGGGLGATLVAGIAAVAPHVGVDPRIGALVGMAAMFAGASRALLASAVFAFETTRQPLGLLPLLGGCSAAYLVSCLMMRTSIMTEKIARRGVHVPSDYGPDELEQVAVRETALRDVVTLDPARTVGDVRAWLVSDAPGAGHQGFPLIDVEGRLQGVLTRRDLLDPVAAVDATLATLIRRPAVTIAPSASLRRAADVMVHERLGRLPVVDEDGRVIGIVTRSDLLEVHRGRIARETRVERFKQLGWRRA